MTQERIQDIHEYREATRTGMDLPDVKFAHEAIDELLDALKVAYSRSAAQGALSCFHDAEETQHLSVKAGGPAAELPNQGATNPAKGSITRLVSASLFDNPNPWVATCGWCSATAELGTAELRLPQDIESIGWHPSFQFGYLCPRCKPVVAPAQS